jgi:hypothetical protein
MKYRSIIKGWKRFLQEGANAVACPKATQDVKLNTINRNKCRDDHMYGPMNPLDESNSFWQKIANKWNSASADEAKGMRCGNCIAFDVSPRMRECIPIVQSQYKDEPVLNGKNNITFNIKIENIEGNSFDDIDKKIAKKKAADFPDMPENADAGFGYCWMHHFKCHGARTCDTWAGGGPIVDDDQSYDEQEKINQE